MEGKRSKAAAKEDFRETMSIKKKPVIEYDVSELADQAAEVFNTKPEVVFTALSVKGVNRATVEDAKKIITTFLERKV